MNGMIRLAAFALPIVGLGGLWASADYNSRQGTDWDVPIQGYDPRDLLRGHYVEFRYDWPEPAAVDAEMDRFPWEQGPVERICIYGQAPTIERIERLEATDRGEDCADLAVSNPYGVYGNDGLRRGRLYVSQQRALEIERELRDLDQRGIVRVRVRSDGTVTPIDIRFRELTEAEIEARDAEQEAREAAREERVQDVRLEIAAESTTAEEQE